jgi:hypothetical protein
VKITRPIAGILLAMVVMVFVLCAYIWVGSYTVDETAPWEAWKTVERARFWSHLMGLIVYFPTFRWRGQGPSSEAESLVKENGGWRRAMFRLSVWRGLWRIRYPYAPHWMQLLSIATLLWVATFLIGKLFFDWALFSPQRAGSARFTTVLPMMFAVQALPILFSKWREHSQPAALTSPEVSQI